MARPGPGTGQQPVSFKYVPNRQKTQKWQQAKNYDYSGDDWGGYDDYDEYGDGYQEQQQQQPPPQQQQIPYGKPPKRTSFDRGDETRQFSAGPVMQGVMQERAWSPAVSTGSGHSGDYPRPRSRPRDFTNPDQAPPPLNTRASPAPGPNTAPAGFYPPPRKQSLSRGADSPASTEKELPPPPFIRPSDIYRRIEAEREKERQSSEGSRPSMESLGVQRETAGSPAGSAAAAAQRPLSAVEESPQTQQGSQFAGNGAPQGFGEPISSSKQRDKSPELPPIKAFSGFGSDMFPGSAVSRSSGEDTTPVATRAPTGSDPAADILRERTAPAPTTRAPTGTDPAADILAERQHTRAMPHHDPAADILAERQYATDMPGYDRAADLSGQHRALPAPAPATRAPNGADPAADILAERQHTRAMPGYDRAAALSQERAAPVPEAPTRAPAGSDPAADILAERQHTRAMPTYDPAAEILAERSHTRAVPGTDPAADILAERTGHIVPVSSIGRQPQPDQLTHQPSSGYRSMVNRAFDRKDDTSSMPATPVSRDGSQSIRESQSGSGVSRSNTDSTSGISPIMSRVPSAAPPRQQPTIVEEPQSRRESGSAGHKIPRKPSPSHSRNVSGAETITPTAAGVAAAGISAALVAGTVGGPDGGPYRRSLDPPSADNSPARTPGLENAGRRSLSNPLTAETFSAETPAVEDQAVEMRPLLERAETGMETPASEIDEPEAPRTTNLPTGRPRAGTDYSVREVDLANDVNDSNAQPSFSPEVAEQEQANRNEFLRTHAVTPGPRSPGTPTTSLSRTASPINGLGIGTEGGRASPAKVGRVREIAGRYQEIHDASRRDSEGSFGAASPRLDGGGGVSPGLMGSAKSSWSNFRGSEENLHRGLDRGVKRQGTERSVGVASESDYGTGWEERMEREREEEEEEKDSREEVVEDAGDARGIENERKSLDRPELGRPQPSFVRPHLPGEWVSYAATPAGEIADPVAAAGEDEAEVEKEHVTPRASLLPAGPPTPVDLTPTTRKVPLEGTHNPTSMDSRPATSQGDTDEEDQGPAPDFSPTNPSTWTSPFAQQAKDAGSALGAALMSSVGYGHHQTRDFASTEPAKEVEQPDMQFRAPLGDRGYNNAPERPWLNRGDTEMSAVSAASAETAVSGSGAPTPSETAENRSTAPTPSEALSSQPAPPTTESERSQYFSSAVPPLRAVREASPDLDGGAVSAFARPQFLPALSTDTASSGLQRDDSLRREIVRSLDTPQQQRQEAEDVQRTQDALDAPGNMQRVLEGKDALPAAEMNDDSPSKPLPLRMLDQRFSWENRSQDRGMLDSSPATGQRTAVADCGVMHAPTPRVMEPEPDSSPEIKPEMPYERPRSRGLHIMNAEGSDDDEEEEAPRQVTVSSVAERGMETGLPVGAAAAIGAGAGMLGSGPVSPITKSQENLHALVERQMTGSGNEQDRGSGTMKELVPSPISDADAGSPRLPSYYIKDAPTTPQPEDENEKEVDSPDTLLDARPPRPPSKDVSAPTSPTGKSKIPPFREILAIKSPGARIKTYEDTRQTFAEMNTGLSDWLSNMLAQHPEHANLSTTPAYKQSSAAAVRGHKASPSLAKFTRMPFTSTTDLQRSNTVAVSSSSAGGGGGGDGGGVGAMDKEKLQQRGKDLVKGAGVLGGKAQGAAKGLFAKGRSRFGTMRESRSKASSPLSTTSKQSRAVSSPLTTRLAPPAPAPPPALSGAVFPDSSLTFLDPPSSTHSSSSPSRSPAPASAAQQGAALSRTQTPSSLSSLSRPLSRTFSRLREHSRSLSRSSSRRSRSRPASVVIPNPDLQSIDDASPHALQHQGAVSRQPTDNGGSTYGPTSAISPWEEPDGSNFARQLERSGAPTRLGVLPSPIAETFRSTSISQISPPGTAETVERPSTPPRTAESFKSPRTPPVNTEDTGSPKTPTQGLKRSPAVKKGSDRARILGRQRNDGSPRTTRSPVSPVVAVQRQHGNHEDDEATPTATTSSQPGPPDTSQADEGDFDELYDTTPKVERKSLKLEPVMSDIGTDGDPDVGVVTGSAEEEQDALPWASEADDGVRKGQTSAPDSEATIDVRGRDDELQHQSAVDNWDNSSAVSAEKQPADKANERQLEDQESASRHSSVSSLGRPANETRQSMMSAHAIPAGPAAAGSESQDDRALQSMEQPSKASTTSIGVHTSQEEKFMDRPYRQSTANITSSLPSGIGSDSAPNDEAMDPAAQAVARGIIQSGMTGNALDTPPSRQQPAVREPTVSQTQRSQQNQMQPLLSLSTGAPIPRSSQPGSHPREARSKRFSGLFRGQQSPPTVKPAPAPPAPSNISDIHGLEGLQENTADVVPRQRETQEDGRQDLRRSGLWESFGRPPSVTRSHFSADSSLGGLDAHTDMDLSTAAIIANTPVEDGSRSKTHRMPQRAISAAAPSEPKKKRFSALGSMFGRSSTTGHKAAAEKPKKLVKSQQPSRESSRIPSQAPDPNTRDYDAYEALRRQQMAELQQRQPNTYAQSMLGFTNRQYPSPTLPDVSVHDGLPSPPEGWYAPAEPQYFPEQRPTQQIPSSPFRRLHSDRAQIPESYRPVEASFNRPVAQIGPRDGNQSPIMYSPTASSISPGGVPLRQLSYPQQHPYTQSIQPGPLPQRQLSYGSNEYQLSPQVSGQSEWVQGGWRQRGSSPSISPVQSRTGSDGLPGGRVRVGSIGREIARSPARDYPDQQTPWSIGMPRPGEIPRRDPQVPSFTTANNGMPADAGTYAAGDFYYDRNVARGVSRPRPYLPPETTGPVYSVPYAQPATHVPVLRHPQARASSGVASNLYSPPPYGQEPRAYTQQPEHGQMQRSQQGRYYAQPNIQQSPPPVPPNDYNGQASQLSYSTPRPLYNSAESSHTSRGDDPAVDMRGASYPGQEWTPDSWD